jgi:cell division protein FtsB
VQASKTAKRGDDLVWYDVTIKTLAMVIPLASFAALVVSIFFFAKTKGQKDAMQSTIDTYKGLADARKAQIEDLEEQHKELLDEVRDLRYGINMQKEVMCTAIDELVAGFARAGKKIPKPDMKFCSEEVNT